MCPGCALACSHQNTSYKANPTLDTRQVGMQAWGSPFPQLPPPKRTFIANPTPVHPLNLSVLSLAVARPAMQGDAAAPAIPRGHNSRSSRSGPFPGPPPEPNPHDPNDHDGCPDLEPGKPQATRVPPLLLVVCHRWKAKAGQGPAGPYIGFARPKIRQKHHGAANLVLS